MRDRAHPDGVIRSRRLPALLVVFASVSAVSCSDDLSNSSPDLSLPVYGSATIEPPTVKQGDSIVVTPAAEIEPICTAQLALVLSADAAREPMFQLINGQLVN